MFSSREWLGCLFRKNEGEGKLPCQSKGHINASLEADNHDYFVLEKHVKETDDNNKLQANDDQEHYALPQDPTYYEATNKDLDDDYDTAEHGQPGRHKPSPSGNVYNTFNDFQHQEDYDHIGDHSKRVRATENEYNTTQTALVPAVDDDTYNHMNPGPKTAARPDNVYGMPRVNNE